MPVLRVGLLLDHGTDISISIEGIAIHDPKTDTCIIGFHWCHT